MAHKITALEPQKRSRDRVNIYLDGVFAFGLAAIKATSLRVGDELSEQDIEALKAADQIERAYENALNFLSYRPRSKAELQRYLSRRRELPDTVVETVLTRLCKAGLLDDEAFARFWVENRTKFRPRGRRMLVQELRQKGVPPETIEAALAEYNEDASAWKVAENHARRLAHLPPDIFKRRLSGRLARRGFSYDLIHEIIAAYASSTHKNFCDKSEDE